MRIRVDNGSVWCGGSERRLKEWNQSLKAFDIEFEPIEKGKVAVREVSQRIRQT